MGTTLSDYADKLAKTKDGKKIFFNDDQIKSSGDLLIQIDLANTLERIAILSSVLAKSICINRSPEDFIWSSLKNIFLPSFVLANLSA